VGVSGSIRFLGTLGKFLMPVIQEMGTRNNGFDLEVNPCGWGTGAIPSPVQENQPVVRGERELVGPGQVPRATSAVDEHNGWTFAVDLAVQHDPLKQLRILTGRRCRSRF